MKKATISIPGVRDFLSTARLCRMSGAKYSDGGWLRKIYEREYKNERDYGNTQF